MAASAQPERESPWLALRLAPPTPIRHRAPHSPPQIAKYPIVRLADWELPGLLKLDPSTDVSPGIIARLADWIRDLKARHQLAGVPNGVPLVGGVEEVAWGRRAVTVAKRIDDN